MNNHIYLEKPHSSYQTHENALKKHRNDLEINATAINVLICLTATFAGICALSLCYLKTSPLVLGSTASLSCTAAIVSMAVCRKQLLNLDSNLQKIKSVFTDVIKEEGCQLTEVKRQFFKFYGHLCRELDFSSFSEGTDIGNFLVMTMNDRIREDAQSESAEYIRQVIEQNPPNIIRSNDELDKIATRLKKPMEALDDQIKNDPYISTEAKMQYHEEIRVILCDLWKPSEKEKTTPPLRAQDKEDIISYCSPLKVNN